MTTEALPFQVADLSLADFGRREIGLAEHEQADHIGVPVSGPFKSDQYCY